VPHIHQVPLPDGTFVETGVDEEIAVEEPVVEEPPIDGEEMAAIAPKGLKREYVRDDTGKFSTDGAGGAANAALEARTIALAASESRDPKEADARRRQAAGLVETAAARARSSLGREHPAVRTLSNLSSQARRGDPRKLREIAAELGKVNERLAAEAKAGKRTKGDEMHELDQAKLALEKRDPEGLPVYGRSVYDSMYRSTFQMFGKADDPASESYADGIAWRAVAQAYHLGEKSAGDGRGRVGGLVRRDPAAKAVPASQLADSSGGFYIVPISKYRGAENFYDRTEFREIPDSGGAVVHIGIGRPQNHKNIIDVRVPKRIVDSTPGGSGAISWVQNNWAYIFNIAKADISPGGMIRNAIVKRNPVPRARIRVDGCKFFSTPAEAGERITYDVVYPAWQVDLQGQYATADEVRKMAHDFMSNGGGTNLMHVTGMKMSDGQPAGVPVQSFIADENNPRFPRDAWVMAVKWHPEAWDKIKSGELRGYSIEGQWGVIPLHAGA
jgi:cation transport regulator ChaB